ncbi:MAG: dihydroorotase [Candidatus Njordarchaeia archaeon]
MVNPQSGFIVRIYKSTKGLPHLLQHVDKVINAKESLLLPGIIDLHVHFREPGYEHKETFETGSAAAVAGGITLVNDMPDNLPYIDSIDKLRKKEEIVRGKSYVDYGLYIGLPKVNTLKSFLALKPPLPIGVKVYYYKEEERKTLLEGKLPKDFLYVFHAEKSDFLSEENDYCQSYIDFEKKRPKKAEVEAVKEIVNIAKKGFKTHITHVSSWRSIQLIIEAKRSGTPITFDVAPHHLILSSEEVKGRESLAKCYPPLRDKLNKIALTRLFRAGQIEAIASSHNPHTQEEKKTNLCQAPAGIAAVQYTLPLIYTLFKKIHATEPKILTKMLSENPAKIIGAKKRGKIKTGNYADIIIFDHKKKWVITPENNYSKAKETPYDGMVVRGIVKATILRGKIVYMNENHISKKGKNIRDLELV